MFNANRFVQVARLQMPELDRDLHNRRVLSGSGTEATKQHLAFFSRPGMRYRTNVTRVIEQDMYFHVFIPPLRARKAN